ncbi:MAG: succinate dehydrogenase, hydrophobic membrane anchor protein [Elusimicrobia bacterium]|nr:succinate dehydrogenase, hydrophobic membrane anchor protein [Elusimicrobiota bacterium]
MSQPIDYRSGRPVPTENSFELFAWFFMRVSGVLLLLLAIGHLVIMHLINSIDNINYQFVVERWKTPFWRAYDGLLLFLALIHGMNGIRTILDDYLRPGGWRVFWMSVLYTTGFIILFAGFLTIFTFQPQ